MVEMLGVKEFIEERMEFGKYRKYINEQEFIMTLQNNTNMTLKYIASDLISLVPGTGTAVSTAVDYNVSLVTLTKVLEDLLEVAEVQMAMEERETLPPDF